MMEDPIERALANRARKKKTQISFYLDVTLVNKIKRELPKGLRGHVVTELFNEFFEKQEKKEN